MKLSIHISKDVCEGHKTSKMYVTHLQRTISYCRHTYTLAPFLHPHWWLRAPLLSMLNCTVKQCALQ